MTLTLRSLGIGAVGVLLAAFAFQDLRLHESQATLAKAALAADTLVASHDTSRALVVKIGLLGDSLRVAERRAIQVAQRADAADRALGVERAARDSLSVRLTSLDVTVHAGTARDTVIVAASAQASAVGSAGDSIRRATFTIRDAPYTAQASVEFPRPPAAGTMTLHVDLDSLMLGLTIGCGTSLASGVRPATVTATGPSWATVRIGRVEQDPQVCQQLGRTQSAVASALRRLIGRIGISAGYGVVRVGSGAVFAGPTAVAGFRIWP